MITAAKLTRDIAFILNSLIVVCLQTNLYLRLNSIRYPDLLYLVACGLSMLLFLCCMTDIAGTGFSTVFVQYEINFIAGRYLLQLGKLIQYAL